MSKVLKRIKAQIEREGEKPEHKQVLKLYNRMIACGLKSSMLWGLLTNCEFKQSGSNPHVVYYVYSVKPEASNLLETWSN